MGPARSGGSPAPRPYSHRSAAAFHDGRREIRLSVDAVEERRRPASSPCSTSLRRRARWTRSSLPRGVERACGARGRPRRCRPRARPPRRAVRRGSSRGGRPSRRACAAPPPRRASSRRPAPRPRPARARRRGSPVQSAGSAHFMSRRLRVGAADLDGLLEAHLGEERVEVRLPVLHVRAVALEAVLPEGCGTSARCSRSRARRA